ncbi:MAG: adenylate/guanylate cyclase domain-containing protein [bacterium]
MNSSFIVEKIIKTLYDFSEDFRSSGFYQRLIKPRTFSPLERKRFVEFSQDEFVFVIMGWALAIIGMVLLSVPLDFVIYQYSPEIFWRTLLIKGTGIVGLLMLCGVINYFPLKGMSVDRVCAFMIILLLSCLSFILSFGGGVNSVWFQPLYVFPVVVLLGFRFSLLERTGWMALGVVGMFLGYFGPHPEYFKSEGILLLPILLVFTAFYYIMGSQLVSNLYKSSFQQNRELEEERHRSERLLLNIFPEQVADRLKGNERKIAQSYEEATVVFADIVNFTPLANNLPADRVVSLLDEIFGSFDDIVDQYDVEKIKTIGDEYFVVGGIPDPSDDHAPTMANLALDLQSEITNHAREDGSPFQLRVGMHTGALVAGVIGKKKYVYDVWGDTVNVGSRMESNGVPGKIQLTPATRDAIVEQDEHSNFNFEPRGEIEVKGTGTMKTYFLTTS